MTCWPNPWIELENIILILRNSISDFLKKNFLGWVYQTNWVSYEKYSQWGTLEWNVLFKG